MAAEQNPHEPGILYSYKNEFGEMSVVSEPLGSIVDNINRRIDNRSDPLSTIIKGVEEMWDVSLMKFTFDLTRNSVQRNFSELYGRGRFNIDQRGVPDDARDRIEELMDVTAKDPSCAAELVSELHRWNLWDSYQDRFLKLFRKL